MLQAEVIGNLGYDAQVKEINGKDYVSFDVAHTERRGNDKEAIWISILWYGKGGKMFEHLKKGTRVFVRGSLSTNVYTTRQGETRVSLSIYASEVEIVNFATRGADTPYQRQEAVSQVSKGSEAFQALMGNKEEDKDFPF